MTELPEDFEQWPPVAIQAQRKKTKFFMRIAGEISDIESEVLAEVWVRATWKIEGRGGVVNYAVSDLMV